MTTARLVGTGNPCSPHNWVPRSEDKGQAHESSSDPHEHTYTTSFRRSKSRFGQEVYEQENGYTNRVLHIMNTTLPRKDMLPLALPQRIRASSACVQGSPMLWRPCQRPSFFLLVQRLPIMFRNRWEPCGGGPNRGHVHTWGLWQPSFWGAGHAVHTEQ